METKIQDTNDLLKFLVNQLESGNKQWFGFLQQKITGINLAHQIAARHADKMTPDEIIDYVQSLNNKLFQRLIKG